MAFMLGPSHSIFLPRRIARLPSKTISVKGPELAKLSALSNLTWLNLDTTRLGDEGVVAVGNLTGLTYLHLGTNNVSDEGLQALHGLKNLKTLIVTNCPLVTDEGVEQIKKAIPGLEVTYP